VRQSLITVRLGTDFVNPFRQQIYKSLVSVALKPQTAKPPGVETDGSALSPPYDAGMGQAFLGVSDPERFSVGPTKKALRWSRRRFTAAFWAHAFRSNTL
jgi:hypothetical protein